MAANFKYSQVIDRPVEDVFRFIAENHIRNHPRWDPDIQLEQVLEGPIGIGTVIRRLNSRYGTPIEGVMKVVEYVPNRLMATQIQDGSQEIFGRITFEPLNSNQTKITTYVEIPGMEDSIQNREFMQSRLERSGRNQRQLIESEIPVTTA